MANITYDLLDESFFTNSMYAYHLHLVLADDACSYLIYSDQQLLAYRSYQLDPQNRELFSWKDELQTLWHQDKMLQLSFKTAKFHILHQEFTFVPSEIFDEKNRSSYLKNVVPNVDNEMVCQDDLELDFKNVYSLKYDLQRFIKENYSNVEIKHLLSHLIESYIIENISDDNSTKVFLNFHNKQIQFVCFEGEKMIFANNFAFETANDVSYFLMLVINQLKLNPETVLVYLSGQIEKNTEAYNAIFKYVKYLYFFDYSLKKEKLKAFEKTENHLFLSLL